MGDQDLNERELSTDRRGYSYSREEKRLDEQLRMLKNKKEKLRSCCQMPR